MKTLSKFFILFYILFISSNLFAQVKKNSAILSYRDKLIPFMPNSVKIDGYVGLKIDQCISNRIIVQNVDTLLAIFRVRQKDNFGYNGEFWGKWSTAAALSLRYQPNQGLQKKTDNAVLGLIKTQSADGYITTYKKGDEFKVWDVWNQKYVLLGLIAQYDLTANKDYLNTAVKSADHLIDFLGPGKKLSLEEYGPAAHKGGVNYSILEPIVLLYERTGEKRFLDYAIYIVESWSKPSKYTKNGVRLIEKALAGTPLVESEVLHSYTLMSCFEGLCELYRATGKQLYYDACVKFANNIKKYELMIDGSVSNHEMWYSGAIEQTEMLEMPVETCATATWMKLCYQLLRLTGDSKWADQLEVSLYNALLGAMMPRGEWWAYNSPLNGERVPSRQQGSYLSCCVSSGPRGLLITPEWAIMNDINNGAVINLYSTGNSSFKLLNGTKVVINQETDYPVNNLVILNIQPEKTSSFVLKLRIPEWSKQTILKINGDKVICKAGSYVSINRIWKKDDKVTLELDLRGRIIRAPSGAPQQAIMRGPIVLAMDNRLIQEQDSTVWLISQPYKFDDQPNNKKNGYILPKYNYSSSPEGAYVELKPVAVESKDIHMAFEVPFITRQWHFLNHHQKNIIMCDYASAGNKWSEDNLYKVWLPQPMFMGNMYAKGAGKVLAPTKTRSVVPQYIQKAIGLE